MKIKEYDQVVCPYCENPYPHLFKDGHYECEECGCSWWEK